MKLAKTSQWQGYTLEQLQFARELNDARIELATHKLKKMTEPYSSPSRAASTLFGRLVNTMSYIDYIVLAYKAFRHVRRWFR